jgi:hypothetical protein
MRSVYRSAAYVVAFLGEAKDDSDYAIDLIRNLRTTGFKELEEAAALPDASSSRPWKALRHLFERPYWTRVWIAQELAVAARDPVIACGGKVAS